MNQYIVYILMDGGTPIEAYADEELAHHDCWLCNEAEKFSPDPMPFWVQRMPVNMDTYFELNEGRTPAPAEI
jgi:hypothetical protein